MGLLSDLLKWIRAPLAGNRSNTESIKPDAQEASAKRDPKAVLVKVVGLATGSDVGNRDYTKPELNLEDITNAYNAEAYVRQAIDKYVEFMFKSGWDLVGKNTNSVEYIKQRFACAAEATQIPTQMLFAEMADDLVKYHNVVVAKARADDYQWPSGIRVQPIFDQAPVVGYFPLNVATMSIKRDKNGTIKGWQQEVEGQDKPVKFKPEDIVHIPYKREKGAAFGTPFLLPVLDDIRALRQAEENVLKLIYRNLFPFYHYQVGTPDMPADDTEIDQVKQGIEQMDLEGGLVTSERHSINPIASNQIIDANPYLKYFEDRVFTGLGVPATLMGRGSTANRSTSDNMSTEFIDRIKAMQKVLATYVDDFMINELLREGGFDPLLNPDDAVHFTFREIDIDAQIKAENHAVFKYEHNAITEDEMRALLGMDPITDRALMFMNLVTIPIADAAAAAKAANSADTDNRNAPTNKPKPKKAAASKEEFTERAFNTFDMLNDGVRLLVRRRFDNEIDDKIMSAQLAVGVRQTEVNLQYLLGESRELSGTIKSTYDSVADAMSTIGTEDALLATIEGIFHVMGHRITSLAEGFYDNTMQEGVATIEPD